MCVTAGMSERGTFSLSMPHSSCCAAVSGMRRFSSTGATSSMYGESLSSSKNSRQRSFSTDGAKGRKPSRTLILRFMSACIFGLRASPRMLRPPSDRGPNSMRPLNQPMIFSSAMWPATVSKSCGSGMRV